VRVKDKDVRKEDGYTMEDAMDQYGYSDEDDVDNYLFDEASEDDEDDSYEMNSDEERQAADDIRTWGGHLQVHKPNPLELAVF